MKLKSLLKMSLISSSLLSTSSSLSSTVASSSSSTVVASSPFHRKITLITFDVDGTLVAGSGNAAEYSAHARAFCHAVGKVFGSLDDYEKECPSPLLKIDSSKYHGCTDGLIALNLAYSAFGIPSNEANLRLQEVFQCMYDYFNQFDDDEVIKGIEPLPGVINTLTELATDKYNRNLMCGLVTGNVEGIARKKMRATRILNTKCLTRKATDQTWNGLEESSFLGGFGSDFCSGNIDDMDRIYKDRGEQIMIAYRRAKTLLNENEKIVRVIHVGDAPADILAAKHFVDLIQKEATVSCLGVATGKFDYKVLESLIGTEVPGVWEPKILEKGLNDPDFIKHCKIDLQEDH